MSSYRYFYLPERRRAQFAWTGVRAFNNIDQKAERIIALHGLTKKIELTPRNKHIKLDPAYVRQKNGGVDWKCDSVTWTSTSKVGT